MIKRSLDRCLYIDMDGVAADFDGQIVRMYGKTFDELGQEFKTNQFWHKDFTPEFFSLLQPNPLLTELIEVGLEKFQGNVRFLTALPQARKDLAGPCMHTKNRWGRVHADGIPVTFGPYAIDKQRHCRGKRHVLIDDNKKNIDQWLDTGGQAIYHETFDHMQKTINRLSRLDLYDIEPETELLLPCQM